MDSQVDLNDYEVDLLRAVAMGAETGEIRFNSRLRRAVRLLYELRTNQRMCWRVEDLLSGDVYTEMIRHLSLNTMNEMEVIAWASGAM